MQPVAPGIARKNFIKYLEQPRKLRPPGPPTYTPWFNLRKRLSEKLGSKSDSDLEVEIQRLFNAGNILNGLHSEKPYGPHPHKFIDGWIDVRGLHFLLTNHIDAFVLESETREMFENVDLDSDGKIIFSEFRDAIVNNLRLALSSYPIKSKLQVFFPKRTQLGCNYASTHAMLGSIDEGSPHADTTLDADSIRRWYSSTLQSLVSRDEDHEAAQSRILRLNEERAGLLASLQQSAWQTRSLCLDPSLQLQAYGVAASLKLIPHKPVEDDTCTPSEGPAMPRSKAVALSLFDRRAPLTACLARPHAALAAARHGERALEAQAEEARCRQRAALAEETEELFRRRLPDRDHNGRSVLPFAGGRTAREVYTGQDPRQVDCALLRRGACRDNAVALLAVRARRREMVNSFQSSCEVEAPTEPACDCVSEVQS